MKVTVFSDCHWHGPTPVDIEPEFGKNVFYIGDNHEFKNIPKKEEIINEYLDQYAEFLKKCSDTETKILDGNHEISVGENNNIEVLFTEDNKIAFVHFHRELWTEKKVNKWHQMKPGISKVYLFFIKIKNLIGNKIGANNLKKKHIRICHEIAKKYDVSTVVFGHTHPRRLIIESHDGIRMINVPRGKTILDLDV